MVFRAYGSIERHIMSNRISGNSRGNYPGTRASQPPNITFNDHQPNQFDRHNYEVGDLWLYTDPTPGTNYQELWYLASLKGDGIIKGEKAKWVLLASGNTGNVSSFQMDVGTAEPDDDGIVSLLFGDNTNTEGDNLNTMRVNLNDFIEWPTTNAAGNEGVIYLGGQSFFHNYGSAGSASANTFLGILAGNFTNTGAGNTGIGDTALFLLEDGSSNTMVGRLSGSSITSGNTNTAVGASTLSSNTGGSSNTIVGYNAGANLFADTNTAVGSGALSNVTNASGNIALGYNAGASLTGTDRFNIVIGNAGISGDIGVTRIGAAGVHNTAYVSGITGVTVTAAPTPMKVVNIGTDGQLGEVELSSDDASIAITQPSNGVINFRATGGGGGGSSNPFAFLGVQTASTGLMAVGNYLLGSAAAMPAVYNVGGNYSPGDGAGVEASYTAPVTGKYHFTMNAIVSPSFNVGDVCLTVYELYVDAVLYLQFSTTRQFNNGTRAYQNAAIDVDLDAGEVVTWNILTVDSGGALNGINVNSNAAGDVRGQTFVSGFLIPESSNGGGFSQPFSALQLTDANFAGASTYTMGEQVALTELFDVGNNFYPGDGAGAGAYYQAQDTGIYFFEFYVLLTGAIGSTGTITVSTPARDYTFTLSSDSGVRRFNLFTVTTELAIGDQAIFQVNGSGTTWNVKGNTVLGVTNVTRISGHRIG